MSAQMTPVASSQALLSTLPARPIFPGPLARDLAGLPRGESARAPAGLPVTPALGVRPRGVPRSFPWHVVPAILFSYSTRNGPLRGCAAMTRKGGIT